ncbi:MAG: ATP-dependent DNA helicase RecG [Turneriella sp.]|nr:ATP-dependent DNA helicase RecG [Turneriella sp.]
MITLAETGLFTAEQLKVLSRLKVKDLRDLLYYLPRRYIDRSQKLDLRHSRAGDMVTVVGRIVHAETKYAGRKRFTIKLETNGFYLFVTFFQAAPYLQKALTVGTEIACWGKLEIYRGRLGLLHPEWEVLTEEGMRHMGRIVPVYRITEAMHNAYLTVRTLRSKIETCLERYGSKIVDYLPEIYRQRWELPEIRDALHKVHFPETLEEVEAARRRLAFDELVLFSVLTEEKKAAVRRLEKKYRPQLTPEIQAELQEVIAGLPFALTTDQESALKTLLEKSTAPHPVNHLLMGDVGSGKTLVALLLSLLYIRNGFQVAYLAPTEILARQHYQTFLNLLPKGSFEGVELLTGKDSARERSAKLDRLRRGDSLIAIGTHALIQDDVIFRNLALVIVDEQHRFGVEQREKLRAKGESPDLLSMTATPIPRTLTLAYYGDLEPLYLKQKPKNRLPIDTRLFSEKDLERIYKAVRKYVGQGRQVYIIYPVIEENESRELPSLLSEYQKLEKEVFPDLRLGLLHGKLTSDEKEWAMQKFKEGLIQILVATSVVEVGIDVPNANVIIIRNPDRFGLAQLHQLRGRVGRGEHQSFCILVAPEQITTEAAERLQAMLRTDDGFELAQLDFELRGAGEITGVRQSGASEFRVADLRRHGPLLENAAELLSACPEIYQKFAALKNIRQTLEKGLVLFAN